MDSIERMGIYLKKCRKFLGISAKVMAQELGCSTGTIYRIESGEIGYYSKWSEIYRKYISYKVSLDVALKL